MGTTQEKVEIVLYTSSHNSDRDVLYGVLAADLNRRLTDLLNDPLYECLNVMAIGEFGGRFEEQMPGEPIREVIADEAGDRLWVVGRSGRLYRLEYGA
jgi:hypothetical protein